MQLVGEGTYGKVYKAELIKSQSHQTKSENGSAKEAKEAQDG